MVFPSTNLVRAMKPVAILFCCCVIGLLAMVVMKAGEADAPLAVPKPSIETQHIDESVSRVNEWLRQRWSNEELEPAEMADDLTVYRRLSLALHGTVPSLEEVVAFNADSSANRIERWLAMMLEDDRFAEYFADRLERVLTGVEEGQFLIFRRDRLRSWMAEQLTNDRPWPEITTDLIAAEGLWTSKPSSNFITAAFVDEEGIDENELAGRTVRAFLGQRIDCAQCHDHPFDNWKQQDFEGLAAFYGQARVTPGGVIDRKTADGKAIEYEIVDPGAEEGRIVPPRFPFHEEWDSHDESRRVRLAKWVVHPDNRRYERAIANRIWGLMFGKSWYDPVDDLGHPEEADADRDLLDVLGNEFRNNGGRLKFLIRTIALSDAFRLKSDVPWADEDRYARMTNEWAVFPLVRLRPEQMIGSMFQAGRVRTIDKNSTLFIRFMRFISENDFLKEYGDATDDELLQQSGTIPQALLRMNGRFTRELTETGLFGAAGQLMRYSGDDEALVQNCFLACLTRLPSPEERTYFVDLFQQIDPAIEETESDAPTVQAANDSKISRSQQVRDLYWMLFNSPGFSWNH
ncbi:MAG: DUF1549 domain-containing protein [Fuerstiella sp.]